MREYRNPGRYLVAAKAGSVLSSFEGTQVASDCSLKTTQKKVKCNEITMAAMREHGHGFHEHFRIQEKKETKSKRSFWNLAKVKLPRAYGGCLGVSSRRKAR